MTDRLADGYQPNWDLDYEFGRQGELFVEDITKALGTERIEVKHDAVFSRTGNIYVEFRCKRQGKWMPSGIAITKADYWVFVLHDQISCVVIRTDELKQAARRHYRPGSRNLVSCDRGDHPTQGVAVPLAWLLQHGTRMEAA